MRAAPTICMTVVTESITIKTRADCPLVRARMQANVSGICSLVTKAFFTGDTWRLAGLRLIAYWRLRYKAAEKNTGA